MADVKIYMGQSGLQGRAHNGHATECERDMAQPGPASLFSLTLRDILAVNPSELMRRFTEGVDRLFEGTSISPMTVWSPSIAISEKDGQIKVCAELPGMSKDDVRVELTQAGLTISGERKRKQDNRCEGIYWSERFCGSFLRTIPIPDEAHVEKAKATFENEILLVLLPVPSSRPSYRLSARVLVAYLEEAQALN
jgi:HSP20 family protein